MKRNRGTSGRYPQTLYSLPFDFLSKTGLLGLKPSMFNMINSPCAIYNISHHFEAGGESCPVQTRGRFTYFILWVGKSKIVSSQRTRNSLLAKAFILTRTDFSIIISMMEDFSSTFIVFTKGGRHMLYASFLIRGFQISG